VRSTPVGSPMRLPPRSCRIGGFQSMRIAGSRRLGERARHVVIGDAGKEVDCIGERRRRARLPQGRGDKGSKGHVRKVVAAGHGCRARCVRAHWGRARGRHIGGERFGGCPLTAAGSANGALTAPATKPAHHPPISAQAQRSGFNTQGQPQGQHSGSTLRVNLRPTQ